MEHTLEHARRLKGEVAVPGEVEPARLLLLLAALATGDSRLGNVPAGADSLIQPLRQLGVRIHTEGRSAAVHGHGLQGLSQSSQVVDLSPLGDFSEALLGMLAVQPFSTRVRLGAATPSLELLLEGLEAMGAGLSRTGPNELTLEGGRELTGRDHHASQLGTPARLGLLLAGLAARGTTAVLEFGADRSRIERLLRQRGVVVECRRQETDAVFRVAVTGAQTLAPVDVDLAGDLLLAYPFMVAALPRRGAELRLRRIALRASKRGLLDLLRQLGAQLEVSEVDDDVVDIKVSHSKQLRATRIAGRRAQRISDQAALVAVLATQCGGESVLRDIRCQGPAADQRLARISALLRCLGARIGEYPEGLVIQGGVPLGGARLECHGDLDLAMAGATAAVLAHGRSTLSGAEAVDAVYPDFFATMDSIKE